MNVVPVTEEPIIRYAQGNNNKPNQQQKQKDHAWANHQWEWVNHTYLTFWGKNVKLKIKNMRFGNKVQKYIF